MLAASLLTCSCFKNGYCLSIVCLLQCTAAKKHQIDFEDIRGRGLNGSSSDSGHASDVEIAEEDVQEVCACMYISTRWKMHLKT